MFCLVLISLSVMCSTWTASDQRLVAAAEGPHTIGRMCCPAEGGWAELSAARFFLKRLEFSEVDIYNIYDPPH